MKYNFNAVWNALTAGWPYPLARWLGASLPRQEDLVSKDDDQWKALMRWSIIGSKEWLPDYCARCQTIRVDLEGGLVRQACSLCLGIDTSKHININLQSLYIISGYYQKIADTLLLHCINHQRRNITNE